MEEPYLRKLNGEMGYENESCASPLLCHGRDFCLQESASSRCKISEATYALNLVLVEVWNGTHYEPWQAAAKVDNFMHNEGHNARGEHIIL